MKCVFKYFSDLICAWVISIVSRSVTLVVQLLFYSKHMSLEHSLHQTCGFGVGRRRNKVSPREKHGPTWVVSGEICYRHDEAEGCSKWLLLPWIFLGATTPNSIVISISPLPLTSGVMHIPSTRIIAPGDKTTQRYLKGILCGFFVLKLCIKLSLAETLKTVSRICEPQCSSFIAVSIPQL